jgi:phage/conjugal plasmid C-4 type zinc finger TraR family protein
MDIGDEAAELEHMFTSEAINRSRSAIAAQNASESFEECEDCGCEIPQKRREAMPGCTTCVQCQAKRERTGKRA